MTLQNLTSYKIAMLGVKLIYLTYELWAEKSDNY